MWWRLTASYAVSVVGATATPRKQRACAPLPVGDELYARRGARRVPKLALRSRLQTAGGS